jgi:hypothetical protein
MDVETKPQPPVDESGADQGAGTKDQGQSLFTGGTADAFTDFESDSEPALEDTEPLLTWTAAEFVAHDKSARWYALLALVIVLLATVSYLISRDKVTTAVIAICGILFAIYAGHKPRQLQYSIDSYALTIGIKRYPFGSFRSFTVTHDGPVTSVTLMPLKRFSPSLTLYFDVDADGPVTDVLRNNTYDMLSMSGTIK